MWFGTEANWIIASFFLVAAAGFYVQRVDRRTRLIKMQQQRLSLTFLKIENDISAIQDSLLVLSRSHGDETGRLVAEIRNRRPDLFRFIVERGPSGPDLLRGLEFPDINEDASFWKGDVIKRLGLRRSEDTEMDNP